MYRVDRLFNIEFLLSIESNKESRVCNVNPVNTAVKLQQYDLEHLKINA